MFAICLAAVASLSEDEVVDNIDYMYRYTITQWLILSSKVIQNFNSPKRQLIGRFITGTEQAIANADMLNTSDLSVLQAIIIYLDVMGPRNSARAVWSLTGLVVRTAVSMGLHRDGAHFPNVSPLDAEIRRRVWWHICFLDSCVGDAQATEISISESLFDTREPANLNDTDLDPNMTEAPASREGVTDTTVCVLRCQMWRPMRRIQHALSASQSGMKPLDTPSFEQELGMLQASRERIERDILAHLEPDKPMHIFIAALARISLTRAELLAKHLAHPCGQAAQDYTFLSALASLHCIHALKTSPETRRWGWIFGACEPWHALSILLVQLCARPWGPTCEQAWATARRTIEVIPAAARKEASRRPVWNLMIGVQRHREKEIRRIRVDPAAARQLGLLAGMAETSALELESWTMSASIRRAAFDTSAAEKQLQAETRVSAGARLLVLTPDTTVLELADSLLTRSTGDQTLLADADTNNASSNIHPIACAERNATQVSELLHERVTSPLGSLLAATHNTHVNPSLPKDFSGGASPLSEENAGMDWLVWKEMAGIDMMPW